MIEIDWHPTPRQLRGFGLTTTVFAGAIGAWAFWGRSLFGFDLSDAGADGAAAGLWCLAGAGLALGLAAPRLLRPLYVVLTVITIPIGFVVSWAVLLAVFALVLTPVGLLLRLLGRDLLKRRLEPEAETYWVDHPQPPTPDRYFRQF
jgi:hypothetical protein